MINEGRVSNLVLPAASPDSTALPQMLKTDVKILTTFYSILVRYFAIFGQKHIKALHGSCCQQCLCLFCYLTSSFNLSLNVCLNYSTLECCHNLNDEKNEAIDRIDILFFHCCKSIYLSLNRKQGDGTSVGGKDFGSWRSIYKGFGTG